MANFLSSLETIMKGHGVALSNAGSLCAQMPGARSMPQMHRRQAERSSIKTSAAVNPSTKTPHITLAKALVASPSRAHPVIASMHCCKLTSALSISGMSSISTAGLADNGRGPTGWYSGRSLMRNSMTGSWQPLSRRNANAALRRVATTATPPSPKHLSNIGGVESPSRTFSSLTSGKGKPRADTVAHTQKAQKQAKPMSS
mmetsp:Transcript_27511/g.91286  ORF Transcript_27511/g.91286 Transcript_27511/m.91286 type:complete len:201 (+) Transcript_27511:452-1054(+)